jgi:hypothetical protein
MNSARLRKASPSLGAQENPVASPKGMGINWRLLDTSEA